MMIDPVFSPNTPDQDSFWGEFRVPDISLWELLGAVFWFIRDLMIAGAVVFSVLGLFIRENQGRALALWIMGVLGTLPGLFKSDYAKSPLQVSLGWTLLALIGSGALIALSLWRRRTGHTPPRSRYRRARWQRR